MSVRRELFIVMEMIAIFIEMACVGECANVIFQKMPVKIGIPVTVMDAINTLQPFQFFDFYLWNIHE